MKIKCKSLCLDHPNSKITNGDMRDFLIINTVYIVYGIRVSKLMTYCLIFNGNHLIEVPIDLFDVIDNSVSNNWLFKVKENNDIYLRPKEFYDEYFFENFSDYEPKEREIFEILRLQMDY